MRALWLRMESSVRVMVKQGERTCTEGLVEQGARWQIKAQLKLDCDQNADVDLIGREASDPSHKKSRQI